MKTKIISNENDKIGLVFFNIVKYKTKTTIEFKIYIEIW